VQDFPLKQATHSHSSIPPPRREEHSGGKGDERLRDDCERSLCEYFSQYKKVELEVVELLRRFDYSASKAVLIPSAPGTWSMREMSRWGHMKVRTVLQGAHTG
jgi:hypothetical protein